MTYTVKNYKTKKALLDDFKAGKHIQFFEPGGLAPSPVNGPIYLEGPHYPEPHRWYASGTVKDGYITRLR